MVILSIIVMGEGEFFFWTRDPGPLNFGGKINKARDAPADYMEPPPPLVCKRRRLPLSHTKSKATLLLVSFFTRITFLGSFYAASKLSYANEDVPCIARRDKLVFPGIGGEHPFVLGVGHVAENGLREFYAPI